MGAAPPDVSGGPPAAGAARSAGSGDPRAAELAREYERRFGAQAPYRRKVWALLTRDVFQRYVPEEGTVLELGCGWGEFINQIRAKSKLGMDLNPESAHRLDADVRFLEQDCSTPWPVAPDTLDVVFTSNFFEHLPDKATLRRTLDEALRCLRPGGRLVCLGPNTRYLAGAYWDFWDHYLPLTDLSLIEGLELTGFTIERSWARFLPYTMSRKRTPPLWMLWWYLRLPFAWPVFGRQFLVVAVKPGE
jgi:SAM-dependent methyltransferase